MPEAAGETLADLNGLTIVVVEDDLEALGGWQ